MKQILIAAAAALMLCSLQAQAGPSRSELLAGYQPGHQRQHPSQHHRGTAYRQHRYDNARRYAANAVRQSREAHRLGFYSDHPRWSSGFHRHFEWALRVDARKIERETRKRARKLRELRRFGHYGYGRPH